MSTLGNSTEICSLPGRTGSCTELLDRYYYNNVANECKYFTYSGCGGNQNNFESLSLCQQICMSIISDHVAISMYHVIGFVMIVIAVLVACVTYVFISKKEHVFEPHLYRVVISNPTNKYNTRQCLFVSGIAKRALQSDVKQLFGDYGKIMRFEFHQTRGDRLNICFVEFKSADDAHRAMGELDGMEIEGRTLCVIPGSQYTPNCHIHQTKPLKTTKTTNKYGMQSMHLKPIKSSTDSRANIQMAKKSQSNIETASSSDEKEERNSHKKDDDADNDKDDHTQTHLAVAEEDVDLFSLSMANIDSDFEDYGDEEEVIRAFSDSDQIKFGSHLEKHQMSALEQFVKRKLTIEENIETHYDQNWNRIHTEDIDHEYIGVAINDELENE